jgi:hypothetical protein
MAGKLRLEPTVVGLSKFNESVQKLKNGQVAGYVASNPCCRSNELTHREQSHCRRLQQGMIRNTCWTLYWRSWSPLLVIIWPLSDSTMLYTFNDHVYYDSPILALLLDRDLSGSHQCLTGEQIEDCDFID